MRAVCCCCCTVDDGEVNCAVLLCSGAKDQSSAAE